MRLDDGTCALVCEMKKEKNPWSDDGLGTKSSSAEEQFEALDKETMMEKYRKDMESGSVDVLAEMDAKQAEEMLLKFCELDGSTGRPENDGCVAF